MVPNLAAFSPGYIYTLYKLLPLNVGGTHDYDGYHSQDYVNLLSKGILQIIKDPNSRHGVHQPGGDPEWPDLIR